MGGSTIITCIFALYGTVGLFNMLFCLTWDLKTFYHAFLPLWDGTDILTCVFALNRTDGHFNVRFCLIWADGHFNMRFCLIWDRR